MIEGPAAQWLSAHRDALNLRLLETIKRYPRFSVPSFFAELAALLPALSSHSALLDAAYDLVALHLGRGAFSRVPALRRLLSEWAPPRATLLGTEPQLLAQLSNASENAMDPDRFVDTLLALPELDASVLLRVGAVIAWRLGDARVRTAALLVLPHLPARALLVAMGHGAWSDGDAPMLVAQLQADQWRVQLTTPPRQVTMPTLDVARSLRLAQLGDFTGFGGVFEVPPKLLRGEDPHLFLVRCGEQGFAVTADGFGACIRPLTGELPPDESVDWHAQAQFEPDSLPAVKALQARGVQGQPHGHVLVVAREYSHRLEIFG